MKLKNFWLLSIATLGIILLSWCKSSAPELSFEETLKVYWEQTSPITEFISFMNDKESQIKTVFDAETKYSSENAVSWKLALKTNIVSDNKTKDTKAEISLELDTDNDISSEDGFVIKSAKMDLDTMIKDYNIYFKLVDLSVEANQKEYVWTMMALIDGFKNVRYTINNPEISELLKASTNDSFNVSEFLKSQENQEKFYKNTELTTYDWDPVWKVDFNMEEIKTLAKEIYELELQETALLYQDDEEMLAEQEKAKQEFNEMIDQLSIENTKAYYVIRSAEKVDFILENADVEIAGFKINVSEKINKKYFWEDSLTFVALLSQDAVVNDVNVDDVKIKVTIDLEPKMLSYGINAKVESIINEEIEDLFVVKWNIWASISENKVLLTPAFVFVSPSMSADVDMKLTSERIADYVFETPEGASDILEVLWWLLNPDMSESELQAFDEEMYELGEDLEELGVWEEVTQENNIEQ